MAETPLDRLRSICLALPEATEKEAWGYPTFRVRDKIFAMFRQSGQQTGEGRHAVWLKAPPGAQEILVGAAPETFFVPPYVGHKGWVGIHLDKDPDWAPDWNEVESLVRRSYCMTAPKRLAAQLA